MRTADKQALYQSHPQRAAFARATAKQKYKHRMCCIAFETSQSTRGMNGLMPPLYRFIFDCNYLFKPR